jgi:hypothetical protein
MSTLRNNRRKRRYDESEENGNRSKRVRRDEEEEEEEEVAKLGDLSIGEKRKRETMPGANIEQKEKRRRQHAEANGVDHNYSERNAILRSAYFEGRFKREMQKRELNKNSTSDVEMTKLDSGDDDDDV